MVSKMVSAPPTHPEGETYWALLQEAYEAESTYQMVVATDRRRITNRMVDRRRATRAALALYLRGPSRG